METWSSELTRTRKLKNKAAAEETVASHRARMPLTLCCPVSRSISCSVSSCTCVCFKARSSQLRSCDGCGHGWVAHALEKLQVQPPSGCGPVEVALPGLVFDLSSLVLFGAQAVPVRLKILLDRLYSVLTPEQVSHILQTLGWSLGDYVRGYMLQYPSGKVLDRWLMVTQEEELLILRQFLRFGETRPIVELMSPRSEPELQKSRGSLRSEGNLPADHTAVRCFKSFAERLSLLFPASLQGSAAHCLLPPKELVPSKPGQVVPKPSGTKVTEQSSNQPVPPQAKGQLALKIKADPDKQVPAQSLWNQHVQFYDERGAEPHRGQSESRSPLRPASGSSPSSSYPHLSVSTLRASQRLRGSSYASLHPLPSFSSSFCPPTPPFSSTLQPLPSSPAAGRKGRVCCGVCGKSFYDKGTLKIHYNAVHLKIKHGCTVAGCSMVFSSLRSRNRHSANPNPRLHTSSSRHTPTHRHPETHPHQTKRVCRGKRFYSASPPPSPDPQGTSGGNLPVQATAPPLLLPAHRPSSRPLVPHGGSDSTSITLTNCKNHRVSCESSVTERKQGDVLSWSPAANQQQFVDSGDSVPKKKPRKSSMPVKIQREKVEGRRSEEEEQCTTKPE